MNTARLILYVSYIFSYFSFCTLDVCSVRVPQLQSFPCGMFVLAITLLRTLPHPLTAPLLNMAYSLVRDATSSACLNHKYVEKFSVHCDFWLSFTIWTAGVFGSLFSCHVYEDRSKNGHLWLVRFLCSRTGSFCLKAGKLH